jgi:hypothetical protein
MKKLAVLLLCLNTAMAYSQINDPIKEIDQKRSFGYEDYPNLLIDSFTEIETESVYRLYDLDKDGFPDMEAAFSIENIYMDKTKRIIVTPSKKAKRVTINNKNTNEIIEYMDLDKDGRLEEKMRSSSFKRIESV